MHYNYAKHVPTMLSEVGNGHAIYTTAAWFMCPTAICKSVETHENVH